MTDAHNQPDLARAPTIHRLRPGSVIDLSGSRSDGKRKHIRLQDDQTLLEKMIERDEPALIDHWKSQDGVS